MIKLIDIEKITKDLSPVTSPEYTIGKGNSLHPEGLFSEIIFGSIDTSERKSKYSFIDLHCKILHPAIISVLRRMNRKIISAIQKEQSYKIQSDGILIEDPNGEINGITSLINNFDRISLDGGSKIRDDLSKMLKSYSKKGQLFINKMLVIPAFYRDIQFDERDNSISVDSLNDYYVKIIRLSSQLQSLEIGDVFDVLSMKMNNLVHELYIYMQNKVSSKQGMVRSSLLGKRADFSGRAVIGGASSELKVDEIGIPFQVLVKIFEPFLLYDLLKSGHVNQERLMFAVKEFNQSSLSVPVLRSIIMGIYKGDELTSELEQIFKISMRRVISDKVVLAKRDPALHAESVQAFKPVMVEGRTIKLNILKCAGFNADFDGDQMAIYVPITKEAIAEAKNKMITSESKKGMGELTDDFSKDLVIGCYCLTKDDPKLSQQKPIKIKNRDDLNNMSIYTPILWGDIVTTVGRVFFNETLPKKHSFINEVMNKKTVNALARKIYNTYPKQDYVDFTHNLVKIAMKYYTVVAPTFSINDLILPPFIMKMKDELKTMKTEEDISNQIAKIEKALGKYLVESGSNLGFIGEAGGLKGGYNQVRQIMVAKGLIKDMEGKVLPPIFEGYADGLKSRDFFNHGLGSRAGIADRVLNTEVTGYLGRQMVYALQRVEADPGIINCKTQRTLRLKVTPDISKRLTGRFVVENDKIVSFDASRHLGKVINLRSPMYCRTTRICQKCYGELLFRNKSHYVGILGARVLAEPLTQAIMRTFHSGGAVSLTTLDVIDSITRVMEDVEKTNVKLSIQQSGSDIISLKPGKIHILYAHFKEPKTEIVFNGSSLSMGYGYFKMIFDTFDYDVILDVPLNIDLNGKKVTQDEYSITIEFGEKNIIFNVPPTADVFKNKVKVIDSLMSGRQPYKDPNHFFMKIYDQFSELTNGDLVHMEVLVSNLLRDRSNPSYPARLNANYDAIVGSLKKIPSLESWLSSLNFENFNQSITTGLIYPRPESESLLEKIVTGSEF